MSIVDTSAESPLDRPYDSPIPGVDAGMLRRVLSGQRVQLAEPLADSVAELLRGAGVQVSKQEIWLGWAADPLDAASIKVMLSARSRSLWPEVRVLDTVGSTNAELMALGSAAAGQLLTTEFQSGGRGRRGRSWVSPVGRNLACSVGWRQDGGLDRCAGLSLVVGLAVVDALRTLGLEQVCLKWPNDILVGQPAAQSDGQRGGTAVEFAKLGGILVELQQHADHTVAVIGIGLNQGGGSLARPHVDQPIGDIHELDPGLTRAQVLAAVINALADYLEQFSHAGFAPMVSVWESLHAFSGRAVNVVRGEQTIAGRVLGVTAGGALRVATSTGELQLDAGEVSLRIRADDD